ncbi:MAG: FG-GAP-like repeat-containing protein [Bacteroidota bacterium]
MKSFIFICMAVLAFTFSRGQTYFTSPDIISSGSPDPPWALCAGDIDGDGDIDILEGDYNYKISWYENLDGAGHFGPEKVISTSANDLTSLCLADLDGDGHPDVLASLGCPGKIVWFKNLDGHGTFGPAKLITASLAFVEDARAVDIDGDGQPDIVSASYDDGHITWFKNLDGHGNFGPGQVISTSVQGADRVFAADLDGDGHPDVISDAYTGDFIAWHHNKDGLGTFEDAQVISDSVYRPMSIFAADLDGDGHIDVLSASRYDGKIAWYQNLDGKGHFGPQRLFTDSLGGPNNVIACDIDHDGDMDVVATSMWVDQVVWFENLDGHGNFGPAHILPGGFHFPSSLSAADLDGDGDPDIIASYYDSDKVVWFRNVTLKILEQPQNISLCTGQPASFSTTAKDYTGFRWQVNSGTGFTDLADNSVYSGTATSVLQIAFADSTMSADKYRCRVYNSLFTTYSDEVTLTIGDHSPPVISGYPGNQKVYANNLCNATLPDYTRSVTVTDNCDSSPALVQNPIPGTVISGAFNTITITAMDHANNSASVSFNTEVSDTAAPVITASPGNQITYANNGCNAVLADYTQSLAAADNCDPSLVIMQEPPPGTLITGAYNTLTLTVSDHSNNHSGISFNVEVADTVAPVITCPESITKDLEQGQESYVITGNEFDPVAGTDNCAVEGVVNDLNHSGTLNNQVIPPGTTTVTWQIADKSGNRAGCRFTITVNRAKRDINIYPNPTPGELFFEFNREGVTKITLFGQEGKPLFEKPVTRKIENIDLSGLPAGLYLVRITAIDEIVTSKVAKIN